MNYTELVYNFYQELFKSLKVVIGLLSAIIILFAACKLSFFIEPLTLISGA